MNVDQFRKWVARGIAREGSQVRYADKHKIDRSVMSLVMKGKRNPSPEFAAALGWKTETVYSKNKESTNGR